MALKLTHLTCCVLIVVLLLCLCNLHMQVMQYMHSSYVSA